MAIDWDTLLLAPVMDAFGEGSPVDDTTWPLYTPKGASPFRLRGAVFDDAYRQVTELADGSVVNSVRPVLGVRASLFALPPKQDDSVFIPSVAKTFGVADPQPDGHGHVLLLLMEVE